MMNASRRRLFHCLALAAGSKVGEGAETAVTLDVLRTVSAFHGTNLSDDRLRVLKPVLERRWAALQALRDVDIDDSVALAGGILV